MTTAHPKKLREWEENGVRMFEIELNDGRKEVCFDTNDLAQWILNIDEKLMVSFEARQTLAIAKYGIQQCFNNNMGIVAHEVAVEYVKAHGMVFPEGFEKFQLREAK